VYPWSKGSWFPHRLQGTVPGSKGQFSVRYSPGRSSQRPIILYGTLLVPRLFARRPPLAATKIIFFRPFPLIIDDTDPYEVDDHQEDPALLQHNPLFSEGESTERGPKRGTISHSSVAIEVGLSSIRGQGSSAHVRGCMYPSILAEGEGYLQE